MHSSSHFCILPSSFFLLRPLPLLFTSGLLFGLAFLMKQHGIFFGVFGLLYLARTGFQGRADGGKPSTLRSAATEDGLRRTGRATEDGKSEIRSPLSESVRRSAAPGVMFEVPSSAPSTFHSRLSTIVYPLVCFAAGFGLPYLLTCLSLWGAGVFPQFWFWTVSYAGKYASSVPVVYSGDMLRSGLRAVVGPNLGLWLLPWAGALVMWWEERLEEGSRKSKVQSLKSEGGNPNELRIPHSALRTSKSRIPHARFFLTAFLGCSVGSISLGFYFREHYFITLLPALALLSGVAVSRALHLLRHDKTIELFLALPILLLLVIGVGAALVGNSAFWFDYSPREAVNYTYGTSLFADAVSVGDYLRTNAPPSARVAVLGSEPEILFYSGRRSATGYIYTYPLMENHAYASTMQQQMLEEIERARPDYAVYVDDNYSWLPQSHSERRILDWWNGYSTNLELVLTLPIQGKAELTAQAFPMSNAPDRPPEQRYLLVFKRKPQ